MSPLILLGSSWKYRTPLLQAPQGSVTSALLHLVDRDGKLMARWYYIASIVLGEIPMWTDIGSESDKADSEGEGQGSILDRRIV